MIKSKQTTNNIIKITRLLIIMVTLITFIVTYSPKQVKANIINPISTNN